MKYLERFLRYILWVAVTAVVVWFVRKVFAKAARRQVENSRATHQSGAELPTAKRLFRDPVCGTYVAEDIAQAFSFAGGKLHFCSRDCMEAYRREHASEKGSGGQIAAGA